MQNNPHPVNNGPPATEGVNKGTVRVLAALSLFAQTPSWGVSEISRTLGCAKNSAFQALDTLVQRGSSSRDASGKRYQLGHPVMAFVGEGEALDVRQVCQPYLVRLQALTGVSIFLSIIVGRYDVMHRKHPAPRHHRRLFASEPTDSAARRLRFTGPAGVSA